jgi:hypothetical protein
MTPEQQTWLEELADCFLPGRPPNLDCLLDDSMDPLQFSIDFDKKLPPSAEIGMAQADENADTRWKRWVDGCIQNVAREKPEFTVDDVLAQLEALPFPPSTHNLAALGPRMKEVAKTLKYMTATDRVQRSKRPEKNGNLHRVWKSNLYGGTHASY